MLGTAGSVKIVELSADELRERNGAKEGYQTETLSKELLSVDAFRGTSAGNASWTVRASAFEWALMVSDEVATEFNTAVFEALSGVESVGEVAMAADGSWTIEGSPQGVALVEAVEFLTVVNVFLGVHDGVGAGDVSERCTTPLLTRSSLLFAMWARDIDRRASRTSAGIL